MTISRRLSLVILLLFVVVLGVSGCNDTSTGQQQQADQSYTTSQTGRLRKDQPPVNLKHSNELQNINRRTQRVNNPSEIGYIYVIAYNLVFGPYQVIGKCTSTESLYSSPVNVINADDPLGYNGVSPVVVPASQPDGSFGQNESAIYCFLNDAPQTMVEFNTQWIWTEKPLVGMPTVPGSAVVPNGK